MSTSHFIVLIEDGRSSCDALAASLVRLGLEPIPVASLREAAETVKSGEYAIRGVLIPAHLGGAEIKKAMKTLLRSDPQLAAMAYGKSPNDEQRAMLQRAGVLLALWDGYNEGILRFQMNRLVTRDSEHSQRNSRRAPTHTPVRILIGGREKVGVLYSISEGGCFIETPRASMEGAMLSLRFELDDIDYSLDGLVVFSNVPGNLQRPNLPLGMGVGFEAMPNEARWQLADFIREHMDSLEI